MNRSPGDDRAESRGSERPVDAEIAADSYEYAGFWIRVGASLIDTALLLCVTLPLLVAIYGWAYFDVSKTGNTLTLGQSIGRYLGYFVSSIPLALGLIWVAFDPKKQGWHDKLAGTVVIRSKNHGVVPVKFEQANH